MSAEYKVGPGDTGVEEDSSSGGSSSSGESSSSGGSNDGTYLGNLQGDDYNHYRDEVGNSASK